MAITSTSTPSLLSQLPPTMASHSRPPIFFLSHSRKVSRLTARAGPGVRTGSGAAITGGGSGKGGGWGSGGGIRLGSRTAPQAQTAFSAATFRPQNWHRQNAGETGGGGAGSGSGGAGFWNTGSSTRTG